jgi:hypothetical protein
MNPRNKAMNGGSPMDQLFDMFIPVSACVTFSHQVVGQRTPVLARIIHSRPQIALLSAITLCLSHARGEWFNHVKQQYAIRAFVSIQTDTATRKDCRASRTRMNAIVMEMVNGSFVQIHIFKCMFIFTIFVHCASDSLWVAIDPSCEGPSNRPRHC